MRSIVRVMGISKALQCSSTAVVASLTVLGCDHWALVDKACHVWMDGPAFFFFILAVNMDGRLLLPCNIFSHKLLVIFYSELLTVKPPGFNKDVSI